MALDIHTSEMAGDILVFLTGMIWITISGSDGTLALDVSCLSFV